MPNSPEELPSKEELRQLPHWALVAYAARCAQRVFPLFERWAKKNKREEFSADVAHAIRLATRLAKEGGLENAVTAAGTRAATAADADAANADATAAGKCAANAEAATYATYAAYAAATAATAAAFAAADTIAGKSAASAGAPAAAENAAGYAVLANSAADFDTTGHLIIRASRRDFGAFLSMTRGIQWQPHYGMDPQSLPNLWIDGAPDWYYESELLKDILPPTDPEPVLELYFERGRASKESFQRVLEALTKLHLAHGGSGLKFQPDDGFIHVREHVEV